MSELRNPAAVIRASRNKVQTQKESAAAEKTDFVYMDLLR